MTNQVERVTVRLPAETLQILSGLVDSGEYSNISDVVRTAVEEFISARFTPDNISKITVDLPKTKVVELESLVRNGDSVSLDDAVRNAVREYVRVRMVPEERDI
jgi:Arc/MetJ-type ribon-helix-helix transcriptional regulator